MNKYKDCQPIETISKIRDILKKHGFFIYEPFWTQTNNCFYSVRIELDNLPRGVNGKGTNRLFTLASAYGELMERLQNRVLIPRLYGWKDRLDNRSFPDEDYHDVKSFLINEFLPKNNYFGRPHELTELLKARKSFNISVPFFNATRNIVEQLPLRFLSIYCGTNGMCAGNSNEEAIIQGICEILERYLIKKVIIEETLLPSIPIDFFKNYSFYNHIKNLELMGYTVLMKDCTLNGKIPVFGVVILNPKKTRYCIRFGSHPILEIAIERCFTETFQGVKTNDIEDCLMPVELNYRKKSFEEKGLDIEHFIKNGKGQLPDTIFYSALFNEKNLNVFYLNTDEYNNQKGLFFLLDLLKKDNRQIYIRDLSFFDFPTFKIYIPGMSEIYLKNNESINKYIITAKASKIFLNLNNSSNEDIVFLSQTIEALEKEKTHSIINAEFFKRSGLIFNVNDSIYQDIEINYLLCLLNIKIKNYKKAFDYLNEFLFYKKDKNFANISYYMCALSFLKFKAENKNNDYILKHLSGIYGKRLSEEVINDLTDEKSLFNNCNFPTCPECEKCPISNNCKYKEWEYFNKIVIDQMKINFRTQGDLISNFENTRVLS